MKQKGQSRRVEKDRQPLVRDEHRLAEAERQIRPALMRDVANLAGVSVMTVSRALNGSAAVTDVLRTRVLEAVARLEYRPNEVARSLRAQRSRQIGLIVPNLVDPFFAICADAVSLVAKKHGYSVVITTSDEDLKFETEQVSLMAQRSVEGIILVPALGKRESFRRSRVASIPIVTLDRPLSGSSSASVVVENREGARRSVEHLIGHGCRRIVHLCLNRRLYTLAARERGYRDAMRTARLVPESVNGDFAGDEMIAALRSLRVEGPFALFCSNNLVTRRALHSLTELNWRVPEEVPLVGFDDFETADIMKPAITVVRQPIYLLGTTGAEILFEKLADTGTQDGWGLRTLPVELIVRNSCGCLNK